MRAGYGMPGFDMQIKRGPQWQEQLPSQAASRMIEPRLPCVSSSRNRLIYFGPCSERGIHRDHSGDGYRNA